ncbi:MAG TPA: transcription termination factor Rho [Longimicrobiaceae bacterium]|nr:transcription termination factor Rho [Longimicrobiaceae bacterium]
MTVSAQSSRAASSEQKPSAVVEGLLEVLPSGSGFLRLGANAYLPADGDPFVPQSTIRRFGLRTGDKVAGEIGASPGRGKSPPLQSVTSVNGFPPEQARNRPDFNSLPATYPDERLTLEHPSTGKRRELTPRIIDLIAPLGKGQRALIVAPSRAGKTTLLQEILQGVSTNYPGATLLVLLVDERPEEVTEMQMLVYGEVIASSFDCPPDRHVAVAEMVLEHARRQVESGRDVVLVLDSLTRLARAYNNTERGTGRLLSGGIDSGALEKPKRFFGSARKVRGGGGSLTIVATALVDTGSRMDEVIFEEFKGTGNSEIVLDRELADKRIYPAINIEKSATRREDLLIPPEDLDKVYNLRRVLHSLSVEDALQLLVKQMSDTRSNAELLSRLK